MNEKKDYNPGTRRGKQRMWFFVDAHKKITGHKKAADLFLQASGIERQVLNVQTT